MLHKSNIDKNNLVDVLLRPQFLVFSFSVIFSQIATNMLNIVLILQTYKLTNSSFAVSILVMTFLLPQILLSFFGGIIADAKNKRKILLYGNAARVIILFLFFFVKDSLVFIYTFQLAIALVTQFYIPAETPIIPYLVKKEQILAANSIFGICLFGSILLGYVGAGPAIRFFGTSGVFLFMSGLSLLAFLCILFMSNIKTKTEKIRTEKTMLRNIIRITNLIFSEFRICIDIVKNKIEVASALIFLILSQVIILVIATIIPDYAQKTLGIGSEDISLIIFAPAAFGMILASFLIGLKFSKIEERVIDFGIFFSVGVMILFSTIDSLGKANIIFVTSLTAFLAGTANACIFVPAQAVIQTQVEEKYLSKIYGLLFAGVGVMSFIPIILAGVFADVLGVKVNLIGIAVLLLLLGLSKIIYFNKKLK